VTFVALAKPDASQALVLAVGSSLHSSMSISPLRIKQHLLALRAAGALVPSRPLVDLQQTVMHGRSPSIEEMAADASYQLAVDAWVAKVEQLHTAFFSATERTGRVTAH